MSESANKPLTNTSPMSEPETAQPPENEESTLAAVIPTPRTLKEKWLKLAEQQMEWAKECPSWDGGNAHTCRGRARIYRECAADLDALLAAEGREERMQENDHGAALTGQPIPDVDGTEPRLRPLSIVDDRPVEPDFDAEQGAEALRGMADVVIHRSSAGTDPSAAVTTETLPNSRDVLREVILWAESRCPCEGGQPDPCTLCGAEAVDGVCKAIDVTFPSELLNRMIWCADFGSGTQPLSEASPDSAQAKDTPSHVPAPPRLEP